MGKSPSSSRRPAATSGSGTTSPSDPAAKDALIAELRYALACARDTDNIFDLIRICDDALALPRNDRALIRHDLEWIREIDRLKALLDNKSIP